MRMLARAVAAAIGLAMGGTAFAEQWNDPAGRMRFETPRGWMVRPQNAGASQSVVWAFNPTNDCFIFALDNPVTATVPVARLRASTQELSAEGLANAANSALRLFPNGNAQLVSQTVDTSGFWPVRRVEFSGSAQPVFGVVAARPGFEMRAFCTGSPSASAYEALFNSLGHPNDAAWQAEAAPTPAPTPAQ
jgi:hypothetical protein